MSRRFLFMIAAFVVMLYFSVILLMLNPLHSTRGFSYSSFPYKVIPAVDWCKPLQFRDPPGDIVALASYPGSGNTWLRYLLQQATGILTGSIYLDHGLRRHGFPAENITDGTVLVVKTHEAPPLNTNKIKSAILLIRNPRDAILAEFNRMLMGHIGTAPKSAFKKRVNLGNEQKKKGKTTKRLDWEPYVFDQLKKWETFNSQWICNYPGAVHVVFYEALANKDHTSDTLKQILNFLNHNVTDNDLSCALHNREGIYRRKNKHKDFDPFTIEMYKEIDAVRTHVQRLVINHRNPIGSDITL